LDFLGKKDPKYVDLVSMTDSFKDNPGEKRGLWRQLPAGTDGAYQLVAAR
jgi:hypothetical protein